jgi:LysM repeat protein
MVRKPARFLAPIALAATITVTYLVVHKGLTPKTKTTTTTHVTSPNRPAIKPRGRRGGRPARVYVVRAGDSLSTIAAKTGVPLATLEALNPKVNPSALQTGQRLRLRR